MNKLWSLQLIACEKLRTSLFRTINNRNTIREAHLRSDPSFFICPLLPQMWRHRQQKQTILVIPGLSTPSINDVNMHQSSQWHLSDFSLQTRGTSLLRPLLRLASAPAPAPAREAWHVPTSSSFRTGRAATASMASWDRIDGLHWNGR